MAEGAQAGSVLANRLIDPSRYWEYENEFTSQQTALNIRQGTNAGDLHITNVYINVNGIVNVYLHLVDGTVKFKFYGAAAGNGVFARLRSPIKIAANADLFLTSTTGATFFLLASGYFKSTLG